MEKKLFFDKTIPFSGEKEKLADKHPELLRLLL